jgi:hypothetical protein
MRNRGLRLSCAFVTSAFLSACDLEVPPPPPIPAVDVTIDFCSDEIPIWVGYQQLGQNWVRLTPNADGAVSFSAEYRVAIGIVRATGGDIHTELFYTTSNVLSAISNRSCPEEAGTKTVNGTVINFSGSQRALVGMGVSSVYREPGVNSFTLTNLPDRALDIMASRMTFVGELEQHANKTILRRTQTIAHNGTIPVLDFDATEAFTPTTASITVSAVNPDDFAYLTSNFFSQLQTSHLLTYIEPIANGTHQVEAIPAATSAAGDYHDVFVTVVSPTGTVRGAERFFRTPSPQTLAVGAELSNPILSTIATSPTTRIRTQLVWQAEYPSAVTVDYDQQLAFSANRYTITVTAGYLGATIFTWDIPMDDMSGAPGWQNSWGLQNGEYDWTVTAYGVRSELLLGAPPVENELARFAYRMSEPDVQPRRVSAPPRPTHPGFRARRR